MRDPSKDPEIRAKADKLLQQSRAHLAQALEETRLAKDQDHHSQSDIMSSSSQVAESWISAFCGLVGHEYFAEVSEDFIEDDFNLTGLASQVPMYKEALEMILDVEPEDDISDEEEEEEDDDDDDDASMRDRAFDRRAERRHMRMASDLSVIESSAEMLYGLIHQRFITSRQGIQIMAEKYELGHFGHCPRVFCGGAKVLPVGCSDIPGHETVKLFCPACLDVYTPPNSRFQSVDGAFFGTTFGCLFFMTFPDLEVGGAANITSSTPTTADLVPLSATEKQRQSSILSSSSSTSSSAQQPVQEPPQPTAINGISTTNLAPGLGASHIYEPRIYGFRVAEIAKSGPRMKWLRSRPVKFTELDEVAIWESSRTVGENKEGDGEEDMDALDEEDEVDDEEGLQRDLDAANAAAEIVGEGEDGDVLDAKRAGAGKKGVVRRKNGDGEGGTKVG